MFLYLLITTYLASFQNLTPNAYREKSKEFLQIDFPLIPYSEDSVKLCQFVKLDNQLRELHLFESSTVRNFIPIYHFSGTNEFNTAFGRTICTS
ncbi:MAG: type ISP restriction/modification enzyme [Candidatus Saccharimonadaceae bacterium]